MSGRALGRARQVLAALDVPSRALWPTGLVAGTLVASHAWLPCDDEAREWAGYLALGTLVPVLGLVLVRVEAAGPRQPGLEAVPRFLLFGVLLALAPPLLGAAADGTVLLLAGLQLAAWLWRARQVGAAPRRGRAERLALVATAGLVSVLAWQAASRLFYWVDFPRYARATPWRVGVLAACVGLVIRNVFWERESRRQPWIACPRLLWTVLANGAALLILAALAFDSVGVLRFPESFAHWGAIVGAAQLVRQGEWLLWDVPSQYGFLSILALAVTPTSTTWHALYLWNSAFLLLAALLLFGMLRMIGRGPANWLFAVLVTGCAVFLVPGLTYLISGVQVWPSAGPFRFFWCHALLAVLIWHEWRRPGLARVAGLGSGLWLIGTLWSAESAAYCAVVWLPAHALLVWQHAPPRQAVGRPARLRFVVRWLLLPPLLLAAALASVSVFFRLRLGTWPDFRCFWDPALMYSTGVNRMRVLPLGPVWFAVLVFCAVSTAAVETLRAGRREASALVLVAGAWGAVWATTSYFVPHSHLSQVPNLVPIYCLAAAVLLWLMRRGQLAEQPAALLRCALVPFFSVILFAPLGNRVGLALHAKHAWERYREFPRYVSDIAELVPAVPAATLELLVRAGVQAGDRITSLDRELLGRFAFRAADGRLDVYTEHRAFLPVMPGWNASVLAESPERFEVALRRFIARRRPSGWLLIPKQAVDGYDPSRLVERTLAILAASHDATRSFESETHRLVWLSYRGPGEPHPAAPPGEARGPETR